MGISRSTGGRMGRAHGTVATAVVADEWPLLRYGVIEALRSERLRVAAATGSGRAALEEAEREAADVLVLGSLPDMSIEDALRWAKFMAKPPRVVALVTQPDPASLGRLMAAGVDGLLIRATVDRERLAAAVDQVLAGERSVSPDLISVFVGTSAPPRGRRAADSLLTVKERQVLTHLADGRSNREIAAQLFVSAATIKTHLASIYRKLGAQDRHDAVERAVALGLLG